TILLISGSPMVQRFRLPRRLDYIKLPCLTRIQREGYGVRSLGLALNETIRLRSDLLLAAVANFNPDLFMADKKPFGIKNELEAALQYLKQRQPQTKQVLVLRDILDAPEETMRVWQRHNYHGVIQAFYDLVLVLGVPEIFDPRQEYQFPESSATRVRFCGYLRREMIGKSPVEVQRILKLEDHEPLVLITAGGGQDGYRLLASYLESLSLLPAHRRVRSLMISGPEMSQAEQQRLHEMAANLAGVIIEEFTDDLVSYLNAAEVVVSMAGFNTVCEILSAQKKAIVVPRVRPVLEQQIRAERLHRQGLF